MTTDISKYREIPFKERTHCVVCSERLGTATIDLSGFPITEVYANKKITERVGFMDQGFHLCNHCSHGQLRNVIDINLQYGDSSAYYFRTSESMTGRKSSDFFLSFLKNIIGNKQFRNVIEVGCSDMYLLKQLKSSAHKLIGIDPVLKGRENELSEENVTAIGDFFENVDLNEKPDIVICKDALEHVSEPTPFLKRMVERGDENTLFFFQFPLLETLLEGCRFDQIFHQHLNYYSLKSIMFMLDKLECKLLDYTIDRDHWGAIIIAFKKGTGNSRYSKEAKEITSLDILERYEAFKASMKATRKRLLLLKDETVYGYGAANMLPVLSYHLENDLSSLQCILDDDPKKDGLFFINLPVGIKSRRGITDVDKSVVLVTAIASKNNVYAILSNLRDLNPRQIILPLNSI